MSNQAQCSHSRVFLRPVYERPGFVIREEWVCIDCSTQFVPRFEVDRVARERDVARESMLKWALDRMSTPVGDGEAVALVDLRFANDVLRADVERLKAEQGSPSWTCVACGSQGEFTTVHHPAGDADTQCDKCGSTEVEESAELAMERHDRTLSDDNATLRAQLSRQSALEAAVRCYLAEHAVEEPHSDARTIRLATARDQMRVALEPTS